MIWFWLGFFGLVALLLFIDLGVLHRKNEEQSLKTAAMWTVAWAALGLAFSGLVYLMYENHWLGADLAHTPAGTPDGTEAAVTYVSAYLLEQALSIDNIFVIALVFKTYRVAPKFQHRVLFWGIIGAVVFRVAMLGGGVWLAKKFDWIFYLFGGYLAFMGLKMLKKSVGELIKGEHEEEEPEIETPGLVKYVRKIVKVVDHTGAEFRVNVNGKMVFTMLAICLLQVELTDVVFALDSIPAVLSVSQETFIIVTSNIFAILGLRSLYFVLAGAMAQFKYLELALGVLLLGIGAKMVLHNHFHVSHVVSLIAIGGILSAGVIASLIDMKRNPPQAPPIDNEPDPSGPGPASPSP